MIYPEDAVELVPHDPKWQAMAKTEIDRLYELLPKQQVLDIQHVGSTAIPNICAKPIIDIQIAVDQLSAIKQPAINILENIDYIFWQKSPDPERLFFVKGMPPYGKKRSHHLHIVELNSRHWREKILFRDYLLAHPDVAHNYENLKLTLIKQYRYDREKFTEGKTAFIKQILQKTSKQQSA